MNKMTEAYTDFIAEVIRRLEDKKLIIFCGAGISYNSGVPLVHNIKREVLNQICKDKDEIEALLNDKIPFELFMQTLIEHSQSEVLLELFDLGEPNENHLLFAKLAKSKILNCIVTTNFDTLIEKAFDIEKINYKVYYEEADFMNIELGEKCVAIIKIHGSVHNKKQMAVTLKRVSEKRLYGYRKEVVNRIATDTSGDALLIMGYSCSDYFDINPIFEGVIETKNTILFLQHEKVEKQTLKVLPISEMTGNNPFKNYPGYFLNTNTDFFIDILWEDLFKERCIKKQIENLKWEAIIDKWIQEISITKGNGIKKYIAGQIFNVCNRYSKAIEYFKECLQTAFLTGDVELQIDSLFALGRCYRDTQKNKEGWQKALRLLHKGKNLSKKKMKVKKYCFCLLSIGVTYEDKKEHFNAIKYYEDARKIAASLGEKDIEAICLGNLGIVMKNIGEESPKYSKYYYRKAIQFQKRSVELSIETGDKGSEGRTYGNIGIIFSCLGNPEKAIDNYEKAYKIANELNDYKHQGIWKFNKGYDMKTIDLDKAELEVKDAKSIFQNIDPPLDNYIETCNEELNKIRKRK